MKASYSDVGEGGAAVNCEKNAIFPEHPVYNSFSAPLTTTIAPRSYGQYIKNIFRCVTLSENIVHSTIDMQRYSALNSLSCVLQDIFVAEN